MQKIVVFGAGYVGLVTGTCLAECGHKVVIVDVDGAKIEQLCNGEVPFHEPGLKELVARNVRADRLAFAVGAQGLAADFYFIAVGTPPLEDGSADTSAVFKVVDTIKTTAKQGAVIVVKSTVPVGTCAKIQAMLDRHSVRFDVASNPEFLKEGDAVRDFFHPDRVVIGSKPYAAQELRKLYRPLQLSYESFIVTDWASAELTKYAANTMLATRISFMNEISRLCDAVGADVHDVRKGIGSDSRIGSRFLFAGPGYGGSCFPKDVQALAKIGESHDVRMSIAEATHAANDRQIDRVEQIILHALGATDAKTRVAFWGLAFKPETDDVREAPAAKLAARLAGKHVNIVGNDPEALSTFPAAPEVAPFAGMGRVTVAPDAYDAARDADALVLLTEWRCYRNPDFRRIKDLMRGDVVVDARNLWRPNEVRAYGLRYFGVGTR